jgi:hypothetical protein
MTLTLTNPKVSCSVLHLRAVLGIFVVFWASLWLVMVGISVTLAL